MLQTGDKPWLLKQVNIEKLSEAKMKRQLIAIGIASVIVGTLYTAQMAKAKRTKPQTGNPVTP